MNSRRWPLRVQASTLALALLIWAGCDSMPTPEPEPMEPDLDQELTDILTFNGQRTLGNFILPAGDDFAAIPQDPANLLTEEKVRLGQLLFHETGLGSNPLNQTNAGTYGCVTCHHAGAGFQAGRIQGLGEGGLGWGANGEGRQQDPAYAPAEVDAQLIRTPSVLNAAFQEVMGWDGGFGVRGPNEGTEAQWKEETVYAINHLGYDGLEGQAIAALSIHRMDSLETSVVATNQQYLDLWETVFPGEPLSLENAGLAIAAYERTLMADEAPFQRWLQGDQAALTAAEKRGAILFFGKAQCEICHTGPSLNQVDFYALGMPDMDPGLALGQQDPVEGRGAFSGIMDEEFQYKVPQLYNLTDSPFFGHGGSFRTLREVVEYYNEGIPAVSLPDGRVPIFFKPLELTPEEVDDLTVFLSISLYDPNLSRYVPNALPSGNCFPANDPAARADLGC